MDNKKNNNWIWALSIVGYFLFLQEKVPGGILKVSLNISLFILMGVILVEQLLIVRDKWRESSF